MNPNVTKEIKDALGPEREVSIAQKDSDILELHESILEDERIAGDETEQPSVREKG